MIFQEDAASRTSKLGLTLAVLLAAGSLPGWAWSQPAAEEPKDPMAATTADPAATPTDPKKDIEPAIEIEVKSPEETAVPTAAKKADPAASPTDPEPTARIELKSSDAVAGPVPKKSEIRLFKKDGYVVQEIPVKGNVSRLTVHRTPGGELVLVMEVDGVTTKTVLELPPSIVKAPVEAMSKAEKDTSVYIRDSLGNLWKREIEAGKMRWVHQRIDGKATADNPLGADKAPVQGSKKVSEDGKTVYVQDENGTIKAIDVASGKTLWINKSDEYSDEVFNKSLKLPPGENAPVSKKVSADGKVVQVQYDNGAVHAYDAKTGKLLWAGKKVGEEGHQKPPDPNRKYVEDNTPALFLFSDKVSTEDLELAEINLQEKQLALESAREDAAVSKDPKAHRNVKLAELSVRRAEIELSRVKAGIRQARP